MSTSAKTLQELTNRQYKHGFVTDIEADTVPRGLNEDVIRLISAKKNEPEFMLDWRLKAYRHWLTMKEPRWQNVRYPPIDYQDIVYYSAPKPKGQGPKSLEEVDPELLTHAARGELRIAVPVPVTLLLHAAKLLITCVRRPPGGEPARQTPSTPHPPRPDILDL